MAVPHGTHERPGRRPTWRVVTPVVLLLSGVLFAVSAHQSDGTDLRGGRFTDLASVVEGERGETERLTEQVSVLDAEVQRLSTSVGDRSVDRVQADIDTLADPAGLTPKAGPAIAVTLTDAPEDVRAAYTGNPNDLVVHQQDIQAVANALWRAGATAVTIQGQRIVSTTGIKCEGNNVTLQGVPYSPPYVIVGIGPTDDMLASLENDDYLDYYREDAESTEGGVGWAVDYLPDAVAPAYDGLLDLSWAEPIQT